MHYFFIVDIRVAVNNIKPLIYTMETQVFVSVAVL
jgi:hypothetical protein